MSEKRMLMTDQDQAARQVMDEDSAALRLLAKDAEIKRLRELVAAGKEDRKTIDKLVDENLRLRELLKLVVDDMVIGEDWEHLLKLIEKEVGDD